MHLYIHVPFCARRCSYCDFAIAVRREVPDVAFRQAIEREWSLRQSEPAWEDSPGLETVYFGGGTPSRLAPDSLAGLLARFRQDRAVAPGAEVTLEANPDDVSPAQSEAWRAAGINRISLGAQSFSPGVLQWMHRTHSAEQIGAAVRTLRTAGFLNLSLDLIYALPPALERDWHYDLEQALALEPAHLSFYALTAEPGTLLGRWSARGEVSLLPDERAADEFLTAHELLSRSGFEHYEVSNAARPGFRARHNSAYWERRPFLGLGPSAHSGVAARRSWNVREWEEYRRRIESGAPVERETEQLDGEQIALETWYLGLRTREGVPADLIPPPTAERWVASGWAEIRQERLALTPEGWLRLDALVASLTRC